MNTMFFKDKDKDAQGYKANLNEKNQMAKILRSYLIFVH